MKYYPVVVYDALFELVENTNLEKVDKQIAHRRIKSYLDRYFRVHDFLWCGSGIDITIIDWFAEPGGFNYWSKLYHATMYDKHE